MARTTKERREQLREVLIGIAEARIAENGLKGLTARDVASEAGCAVGAIYTIFKDMDALAAAVNTRTAGRLEVAVAAAIERSHGADDPKRQLVLLGLTYLDFMSANRRLWSAIFDIGPAEGAESGRQFSESGRLMDHVVRPVRLILPDTSDDRVQLVARGLFAAVHGIVMLGQRDRFTAATNEEIAAQIVFIVETFCDGLPKPENH